MSSKIENRSPWCVTVTRHPELDREYSYNQRETAELYIQHIASRGLKGKIHQLENSFQVRIRQKGHKPFCSTFDTYAAAEQALLHIQSGRSRSIVRDYSSALRTTTASLMQRYIEEVCPLHKGGDVEITRLRRIIRDEEFVDKPLAELTTEDLQDFIRERLTAVAPATVDRDLDVIRQVLGYAADVWKIAPSESPFVGLRRPKYFNERSRRLKVSEREEERLLEAARLDENPYIAPIIGIALATAMRRSEILMMTWEMIDFEQRCVLLPDTKNGRARAVPLSQRAIVILESLPQSGEKIFPITENALKIAFFRRVLPSAGIQDLHFHDLRHEAISRLAESGLYTVIDLQAISGHRDTRMLLRYSHLCTRRLAEKMDETEGLRVEYIHRGRKRSTIQPFEHTGNSQSRLGASGVSDSHHRVVQGQSFGVIRGGLADFDAA